MADDVDDDLEVLVEGARFTGWQTVGVSRQLEAASGSFTVGAAPRSPLPIRAGQEVTVRIGGRVVLRGFVDVVNVRGSSSERTLEVSGRDRTADLVDCSELSEPGWWEEIDLQRLVELIATPFAVEVRSLLEQEVDPFLRFARQSGESAWSAIERACRLRGVLAHSSGDGALVLERAGRSLADANLQEGRNVLSWAVQTNTRQRFASYVVRAQSRGTDEFFAEQAALIEGHAEDPAVERFRPLLVLAEGPLEFENTQDRARWEATVRAARSQTVSLVVQGWRQTEGGRPWELNELTQVLIPGAGLDQVLLVNGVRFTRDQDAGELTELALTRADAYDPQPEVDPDDDLGFDEVDEEGGF